MFLIHTFILGDADKLCCKHLHKEERFILKIDIIAIGSLKEKYLLMAVAEYVKRLQLFCKLCITELPESPLPESPSVAQIANGLEKEGKDILAKVPKGAKIVALCIEGNQLASHSLAQTFAQSAIDGQGHLCFVIGGSFGLSEQVKERSSLRLSMSKMTFPHQLARVMLLEQIYRACSINKGTKYHK